MQTLLDRDTFCTHCGYNLRGQVEPRCPECGEAFDPAEEPPPRRRLQWRLATFTGVLSFPFLFATMFYALHVADQWMLPSSAALVRPVVDLGRGGGPGVAHMLAVAFCSSLLGAVFGLVLSLGATERTHLSGREVALMGYVNLLLFGGLAVLFAINQPSWVFETFEVFCLVALCAVAPFTLGEWAATWVRGRRFARNG